MARKKLIAENWLESLNDEHKSYYIKLLQTVASNGGNVVNAAYDFMLKHKKNVSKSIMRDLNSYEITRSMFPSGILGWFSWLMARYSAKDVREYRATVQAKREHMSDMKDQSRLIGEAVHDATLLAINNSRFLDGDKVGPMTSEIDGSRYRRL